MTESRRAICVRGPWITASYHDMPDSADRFLEGGWWRSGDVGTVDENGYLKVTDRIKDVIKSGGEWISSIDMENLLMGHPPCATPPWSAFRIRSGRSARWPWWC